MKRSPFYVLVFMLGAAWIAQLALPPAARAGGVVGDGWPASCTEAALDAALAGGGYISFDCGPHPYTIQINSEKTIAADTSLDGGGLIRLDAIGTIRIFSVGEGALLELVNIRLDHGWLPLGAQIYNAGELEIRNSSLTNGHSNSGGAVYNTGALTIQDSVLEGHYGVWGAGIYNTGLLDISGTKIAKNFGERNFGGGIYNSDTGILTLSDSRMSENYADEIGPGILNYGSATVSRVIFDKNYGELGGGIVNYGEMEVDESYFSENTGGVFHSGNDHEVRISNSSFINNSNWGVWNSGRMNLENSLFSGNSSERSGGAVYNHTGGTLIVTNSTFSQNSAAMGGGIYSTGTVTITNSTFFGNSPDGLVNAEEGTMQVLNTLLASNSPSNCAGLIASAGYNMEDSDTCGFTSTGDQIVSNPLIGPLADNGGPTWTHALLKGSPAINAGTNEGCPATDQRGVIRPRLGACDIGAYEFEGSLIFLPWIRKQ
jgi:predicted outer membrane repeat protein